MDQNMQLQPTGQDDQQLSSVQQPLHPGSPQDQQQTMSHPSQAKSTFKLPRFLERFAKQDLYETLRPLAENIKALCQMIIGGILAILIIVRVGYGIIVAFNPSVDFKPLDVSPLAIVGVALAISTAFGLAYTLFTDGPDEAVDPLITGIAAAILLFISPNNITFNSSAGVVLLVLVLGGLFILKEFFIDNKGWISRLGGKVADTQQREAQAQQSSGGSRTNDASSPPSHPTQA